MYMYIYVCVYIYIYIYIYTYTHTHIYMYTPVQKFRNRSKFDAYKICNALENKCICIYTHMYIHTLINFVKGFRGKYV